MDSTKRAEVKATVQNILDKLPKKPDSIAVELYNLGVRRAVCEDPTKCALAQYVADKLAGKLHVTNGKKLYVSVSTRAVHVFETRTDPMVGKQAVATVKLTVPQREFIKAFDSQTYSFLERR